MRLTPPPGARTWSTEVEPLLGDRLRDLLQQDWSGPLGPAARELVVEHLSQVGGWAREHERLLAPRRPVDVRRHAR